MQIKDMNCYNCLHLDYYHGDYETSEPSGYFCEGAKKYDCDDFPDDEKSMSTPKPRCFELDIERAKITKKMIQGGK